MQSRGFHKGDFARLMVAARTVPSEPQDGRTAESVAVDTGTKPVRRKIQHRALPLAVMSAPSDTSGIGGAENTGEARDGEAGRVAELARYRARLASEHKDHQGARRTAFVPVPDHGLGLIVKVYDGDTVTMLCEIGGRQSAVPVRLYGVDAPEIHNGKTEGESVVAQHVRDLLSDVFLGRFVHVQVRGHDKYGRLLANARVEMDGGAGGAGGAAGVGGASVTDEAGLEGRGPPNVRSDESGVTSFVDLSEFVLRHGLAYSYNGKAKRAFKEDDLMAMLETCRRLRSEYGLKAEGTAAQTAT